MPYYSYKGLDRFGNPVKSSIFSDSESEARKKLGFLGIKVSHVYEGQTASAGWKPLFIDHKGNIHVQLTPPTVTSRELGIFTRQLSAMIDSGVSITQSLELLKQQSANPLFIYTIDQVSLMVQSGSELFVALEKFPNVFDKLYVSLVEAGSSSGQLDVILKRLSIYLEKSTKLMGQLKTALTYPTIVILLAFVITGGMVYFVVPMFAANYTESGKKLPDITQFVIDVSTFTKDNIFYILGLIAATIFATRSWLKTSQGRKTFDTYLLRVPLIGDVTRKIGVARFASTMSTLTSSGISIIEALDVCARASGNVYMWESFMNIKEGVVRGKGLAKPMKKFPTLFPPMVTGMVEVGEASGKIDQMLYKISEIYEEEVDLAVASMLKMIEPILFIVIGGIVGFILIAMYLPVFDMASTQM